MNKDDVLRLGLIEKATTAIKQALAQPEPTVPTNLHEWKGMDGAIAWHLIDRTAENWADKGKMMNEWLAANQMAQPEQKTAAELLIDALQKDPNYAWSWHCNIAMAFVDAGGDHYTGNQGAARFMKIFANVEPAHELPAKPSAQPEQEPEKFKCFSQVWRWKAIADELFAKGEYMAEFPHEDSLRMIEAAKVLHQLIGRAELESTARNQALQEAAMICSQTCSPFPTDAGNGYNQAALDCEKKIRELIK